MDRNLKYMVIWLVKIVTVLFMFGMTLIIAHTWFLAFFNGDRVLVTINDFGERDPELILWIVGAPILCYGTALVVNDIWKQGYLSRKRLRKLILGKEDAVEWL